MTPAEAELAEERKTNGLLQVRLFEAEAERDRLADDLRLSREAHWADRAKLAARVEELEAALREVTDVDTPTSEVRRIARVALDKETP